MLGGARGPVDVARGLDPDEGREEELERVPGLEVDVVERVEALDVDDVVREVALGPVWNPNRFKIPSTRVFRNEFLGAVSLVVENSGSEYERSKNRGKRVRFDGGRDF